VIRHFVRSLILAASHSVAHFASTTDQDEREGVSHSTEWQEITVEFFNEKLDRESQTDLKMTQRESRQREIGREKKQAL